jgi:lysophospholipase L1-like esterase
MNVMKENKTILCFGDSNTWGYCPVDSRYPASVRWTGQLAQRLGDGWQVIPEGACGRCAGSYGDLPAELCGLPALQNALRQHGRPDWLVVLLGTNDLMAGHARSLSALKQDLCRLAQTAKTQVDQVLLIAPPRILDSVDPDWGFPADVAQTSLGMTGVCRQAAAACGCRFLDGSQLEVDRRDGLHLSPAGHEALARAAADLIRQ